MPDNTIRRSRSQPFENSDRQRRVEGREIQDQSQRPLSRREITPTSGAQEYQSTSLESQLRQQAEQHGINIFGLSAPEMQGQRNQRVDQQASESQDFHSEPEELRREPVSGPEQLWLELRDAPPLRQQRRSMSVQDALHQLSHDQSTAESIRNGDDAWQRSLIVKYNQDLGQGR